MPIAPLLDALCRQSPPPATPKQARADQIFLPFAGVQREIIIGSFSAATIKGEIIPIVATAAALSRYSLAGQ
jgi:hypothetical protein